MCKGLRLAVAIEEGQAGGTITVLILAHLKMTERRVVIELHSPIIGCKFNHNSQLKGCLALPLTN